MDCGEETPMQYNDIASAGKRGIIGLGVWCLRLPICDITISHRGRRRGEQIGHSTLAITDRRFHDVASVGNGWAMFCMKVRWRGCDAKGEKGK